MHNHHMITGTTTTPTPDLQLCPVSPDPHDTFRRTTLHTSDVPPWNNNNDIHPITTVNPHHHNPRKKRTKMIRFHNPKPIVADGGSGTSTTHSTVTPKRKPDPSAPKITRPCTECGKRFWSWKALFGHMRCHPERPWRGINPPPNIHHHPPPDRHEFPTSLITEEDEYVASCLLMLANTPTFSQNIQPTTHASTSYSYQHHMVNEVNDPEGRFECSSCKKVFGSHQALGGHRASHKNVKGCFANTRTEELEYGGDYSGHFDKTGESLSINQQHKCSICLKSFPSGQALGGHKRCHLEKEDGVVPTSVLSEPFRFDLNFPATVQDDSTCSSSHLDLRLRL